MANEIKLEELTVKELQAKAVELGISEEDSKLFTLKASLIVTINTLKAQQVVKKVDTLEPLVSPKEEQDEIKKWQSKADKMEAYFDNQPKVRVLIPLSPTEKQGVVKEVEIKGRKRTIHVSGAVWSKTFNGYQVVIPKGIYTEVAEDIANNISEEFNQTQHAGDQWLIDRTDPITGKSVKEQLE